MKALVFIETNLNGEVKKSSLEALSAATKVADTLVSCSLSSDSSAFSETLQKFGVSQHYGSNESPAQYNPELFQSFLSEVYQAVSPQFLFASSNSLGRDIFPRLAAQFDLAYMSDVTEVTANGGNIEVKRPMYAGKCTAQVTFCDDSGKVILVRPNQIALEETTASSALDSQQINLPTLSGKSATLSIEKGESEKLDLTEAETIVSGGRGLKEAENFKLLDELADTLGATVGASRAVVDLGWAPHSLQVGQTGKTVAPNLYFAVGISGAIQHLAGMSGSKTIVAINKDEKAPIFQKATYGLVGDLFEIVPLLTEKLKSLKS